VQKIELVVNSQAIREFSKAREACLEGATLASRRL
jgi:hypothetical protein